MEFFQSSTLKTLFDPPSDDLLSELESVQFENLCSEKFHDLFTQLRRQSNLLTATHIAHACHFVSLANRIKREGEKLKDTPDKKRSHRLIAEVRREAGVKIGIIGVGRIGHLLAKFLMKYGDVYPDELYLSSRQADLLTDLIQIGVKFCRFNNNYVVDQCDIVFLCIAPHQMRYLIDDLRNRIKSKVLIYSLVLGFPALKLSSLFNHQFFVKPIYQSSKTMNENENLWPISDDIESIFQNEILMKRLSLENEEATDSLIEDQQFVPTLLFALLNILKQNISISRIPSLRILSGLIFNDPHIDIFVEELSTIEPDQEFFPAFDLVHLTNEINLVRTLLDNHSNLRRLFSDTFISHFTTNQ